MILIMIERIVNKNILMIANLSTAYFDQICHFIISHENKHIYLICRIIFSQNKKFNLLRHYTPKLQISVSKIFFLNFIF